MAYSRRFARERVMLSARRCEHRTVETTQLPCQRTHGLQRQNGVWKLWRDEADFSPLDFSQRYTGTFSDDGKTIALDEAGRRLMQAAMGQLYLARDCVVLILQPGETINPALSPSQPACAS